MALPTMLDSTDRAYFQNNVYTQKLKVDFDEF